MRQVGVLAYGLDFFATHEREIAFRKWMAAHRPDLSFVRGKFPDLAQAKAVTKDLLQANQDLAGLWITGIHEYMHDPSDPFPTGYKVSDTWPAEDQN